MFKNYLIILIILISINSIHSQGIKKVINNKGTIIDVDESKWSITEAEIFTKRDLNVGIGTTNPTSKLEVSGQVKITGGLPGLNKVLTSDENGLASWVTPTPINIFNSDGAINGSRIIETQGYRFNIKGSAVGASGKSDNLYQSMVDYTRHGTAGIQNGPSAGFYLGTLHAASSSVSRLGIRLGAYPGPNNGWGSLPVIEAMTLTGDGRVGIGTNNPTATLSVNGIANNTTGSWGTYSDARIKNVNGEFTDGLNVITQIKPIKFIYKDNAPLPSKEQQIGIIAQDLEKIAPYMVTKQDYNDYPDLREVNPQAYIFLLINAIKEQQLQIDAMKKEIAAIKK